MTLPIPRPAIAQNTIVLGKTRSGKSSKMRLLVEQLLDESLPVCILDPKGDWWGLKSSASGKDAGYPVIIFGGEHADVPITEHSGAAIAELITTGNRPCIIDLGGWMPGERTRFFISFAAALFRQTRGLRWLVIDECHNFAPQGKVQDVDAGKMLHWANRLANEGSGKGLTLISASQRPQKVHKDYVTAHETLIATRVSHPLDRKAVTDWMDGAGNPAKVREIVPTLAEMDRRFAWVWSPEIKFGPEQIAFPMFKTYDSFKPQSHTMAQLKGWANVDLVAVKAKFAQSIEEAKANDPRALKAEIVKLKSEIGKLTLSSVKSPAATEAALNALEANAEQRGYAMGYREGAQEMFTRAWEVTDIVQAAAHAVSDRLRQSKSTMTMPPEVTSRRRQPDSAHKIAGAQAKSTGFPKQPPQDNPVTENGVLTRPQRTLLHALAWWRACGHDAPTRAQVAAIAGWTPSGSNLKDRLSELSKAGYVVYPQTGHVALTEAGGQVAPMADSLPLLDRIRSNLTGPQLKLFDALNLEAGEEVTRLWLAEAVGWEPAGSNLKDRLSELSRLELVRYPGRGTVALQDWVK